MIKILGQGSFQSRMSGEIILLGKNREAVIRGIAKRRLESIFKKQRHQHLLERMTKGVVFDTWVELTAQEVSDMHRAGFSNRALAKFVDDSTELYAQNYLNAMMSMAGEP